MHPRARDQLGDFKDLRANFGCNRYSHNLVQCARRALKGNPDSTFDLGDIDLAEDLATPGQPVRPEVVIYVLGTDRYLCLRSVPGSVAETDGSIARISTRSPDSSRPFPRFSPGAWAAGGTHVHFPPRAVEHFVPSGAHECMYVPGMSRGNPRGRPVNNVVRIHAEEPRRPS